MDVFEFLAALQATPREWEITSIGRILRKRPWMQCPLAAVPDSLYLPYDLRGQVIAAADDEPGFYPSIRETLLDACGLATPPAAAERRG